MKRSNGNNQIGFDFCEEAPAYSELPDGSWEHSHIEENELREYMRKASTKVELAPEPVKELYRMAIARGKASLHLDNLDDAALTAFADFCADPSAHAGQSARVKVKSRRKFSTHALYIQDLGSLVLRRLSETGGWLCYEVGQAAAFLESFEDSQPVQLLPLIRWQKAYSADVIAYSGSGTASVKTVEISGRLFTVTSISFGPNAAEGQAWSFCRLEDWKGPTYSYQSQNQVVDRGRIERGDYRGLVVLVRGERVVIDGPLRLYDDTETAHRPQSPSGSDEELEEDELMSELA